jgi:hypothetical protein
VVGFEVAFTAAQMPGRHQSQGKGGLSCSQAIKNIEFPDLLGKMIFLASHRGMVAGEGSCHAGLGYRKPAAMQGGGKSVLRGGLRRVRRKGRIGLGAADQGQGGL